MFRVRGLEVCLPTVRKSRIQVQVFSPRSISLPDSLVRPAGGTRDASLATKIVLLTT